MLFLMKKFDFEFFIKQNRNEKKFHDPFSKDLTVNFME